MIRFCSPIKSHMGYAEMGRSVIARLVKAGEDVSVSPLRMQESNVDFGEKGRLAESLIGKPGKIDTNIVNMVPNFFQSNMVKGAKNIGFTTFEASSIPKDWVEACNKMDAVWVTSDWAKGVFAASGVTVPLSVVSASLEEAGDWRANSGPFRFVSVFQWSARKNPEGLIRAYCAAFDGNKDVILTIKTHRSASPAESQKYIGGEVNKILAGIKSTVRPKIEVVTDFIDEGRINQLHRMANCYISMTHAEGWGLPSWKAVSMGCPIIHTGYSAPVEYLHQDSLIRSNLSPCFNMDNFVPFFDSSMMWGEPHLDHAVELMRGMVSNADSAASVAADHAKTVKQRYAEDNMVELIKKAL